MIGVWATAIIILVARIASRVWLIRVGKEEKEKGAIIGGLICIPVAAVIAFALLF